MAAASQTCAVPQPLAGARGRAWARAAMNTGHFGGFEDLPAPGWGIPAANPSVEQGMWADGYSLDWRHSLVSGVAWINKNQMERQS